MAEAVSLVIKRAMPNVFSRRGATQSPWKPRHCSNSMPGRARISIHQFHSGSAIADAVTNCMFFVQSMLRGFGFQSDIFVEHLDPALLGRIRPFRDLPVAETDLLLIHHSMGHDRFSQLAGLRCRKVLIYHNIT